MGFTIAQLASDLENLNLDSNFDKDLLDTKFEGNTSLKQAWLNYKKTFHDIHEVIDGESVIAHSRATVPSEMFFTESIVVYIPLKVDFYKHLSGMITGVGIIEPPRYCRRLNILREYDNEKTNLHS